MQKILFCWVGVTDLRASEDEAKVGLGPIAQALVSNDYDEAVLLDDFNDFRVDKYLVWLKNKTKTKLTIHGVSLSGPTDFGEIYQAASSVVSSRLSNKAKVELTFHLSPGTSAMAAVWIILAKSKFAAELIESSIKSGVVKTKIPFEIAADFIPELLKDSDEELKGLASGVTERAQEFDDILHRSAIMKEAILKARIVAPRSIPVLIEGESGTGKELFAKAIHSSSPRKKRPLITLNCGAIPPELIESELFGHEKGSFTGADKVRKGCFEEADGGTLFLDEIGELPKLAQVKLLRALQEGEVVRIGGNRSINVNVRVIAATNRNLIEEVAAGNFREDLFFRLAVAVLRLPPLRERSGDIGLLVDNFIRGLNEKNAVEADWKGKKISAGARKVMLNHAWPGNVRELHNTLTRAILWSSGAVITENDMTKSLLILPAGKESDRILGRSLDAGIDLNTIIKEVATHYLQRALEKADNSKKQASELLGFKNYQTLSNWMKKYDVE